VLPVRPITRAKLRHEMSKGKLLLLIGGVAIVGSTLAFELTLFSPLQVSPLSYQIPPFALLFGFAGLLIVLVGCIMVCREAEGRDLLVAGMSILGAVFLGVPILDHLSPALFNVHLGFGGFVAPIAASVLCGIICMVAGIARM